MGQVRTTIGQGAFMGWTNMEGQTLQHFLKGKTSLLLFSLSLRVYPFSPPIYFFECFTGTWLARSKKMATTSQELKTKPNKCLVNSEIFKSGGRNHQNIVIFPYNN